MKLLDRSSLKHKLLVVAVLAIVAAALPTALYVRQSLSALAQSRTMAVGMPVAESLLAPLLHLTEHREWLHAQLNGDTTAEARLQAAWDELKRSWPQVLRTLKGWEGHESAALAAEAEKIWTDLQQTAQHVAAAGADPDVAFDRQTALIERLLLLIYEASVATQVVLHPEQLGYFAQDVTFNLLPQMVEVLARLKAAGGGAVARGKVTRHERVRLGLLVNTVERMAHGTYRAIDYAARTGGRAEALVPLLAAARASLAQELTYARGKLVDIDIIEVSADEWRSHLTSAVDAHARLSDIARGLLREDLNRRSADQVGMLVGVTSALLFLLALSCALLWVIGRRSTASIDRAIAMAESVARGDLRYRAGREVDNSLEEGHRLLSAMSRMCEALSEAVGQVRSNAEQVACASEQISQGNHDLSQRTETQAGAVQQTLSSMCQLTEDLAVGAGHSQQASALAREASTIAAQGGREVAALSHTMRQIDGDSKRIAEIIATIDSIAFQTNILALNAAVEAARAGEQGRGFAVVASEVRALAHSSSASAREIRTLIASSMEQVEAGSRQGVAAAVTVEQVAAAIERVNRLIAEVSDAAQRQSQGVAAVGRAMNVMETGTQRNAALVEQSAAATESLKRQAADLQRAVAAFRTAAGP